MCNFEWLDRIFGIECEIALEKVEDAHDAEYCEGEQSNAVEPGWGWMHLYIDMWSNIKYQSELIWLFWLIFVL